MDASDRYGTPTLSVTTVCPEGVGKLQLQLRKGAGLN